MMKKRWKLILFLLVAAIIAIVVYRRTVSTCPLPARPFPSHTFDEDGWSYQGVHCFPNADGEMMCRWREGYYIHTSNTVTGVETKERRWK